jgi:hypothetical protein
MMDGFIRSLEVESGGCGVGGGDVSVELTA